MSLGRSKNAAPKAEHVPGSMFTAPLTSKGMALKAMIFGKPGRGKTYGVCTFPCSVESPLFIIRTKPPASDMTVSLFQELIDDGRLRTYDAVRVDKDGDEIDLERTADNFERGVANLKGLQSGTVIVDDITDYAKGVSSWMETTGKKIGKKKDRVAQYEWGRVYNRMSSVINRLLLNPKIPVLLLSHKKDVYDGSDAVKETGLSTIEHVPKCPEEIVHMLNYVIELRGVQDFNDEIIPFVNGGTRPKPAINIASFKKNRLWIPNPQYDRFYNFTYPSLKEYLNKKGVQFYEPEGTECFIPPTFTAVKKTKTPRAKKSIKSIPSAKKIKRKT